MREGKYSDTTILPFFVRERKLPTPDYSNLLLTSLTILTIQSKEEKQSEMHLLKSNIQVHRSMKTEIYQNYIIEACFPAPYLTVSTLSNNLFVVVHFTGHIMSGSIRKELQTI